jgi:hypothetical protein
VAIDLKMAIFFAGIGQLCVLIASSLVPVRLTWRTTLSELPKLDRQLFWVYGGYVVLSITSLGLISTFNADELAAGSNLARCFCAYATMFWGIRLSLQPFLDAKPFLTNWWLRCGYHLLSVVFASFTIVFASATFH